LQTIWPTIPPLLGERAGVRASRTNQIQTDTGQKSEGRSLKNLKIKSLSDEKPNDRRQRDIGAVGHA
jgi:hypothetical protein